MRYHACSTGLVQQGLRGGAAPHEACLLDAFYLKYVRGILPQVGKEGLNPYIVESLQDDLSRFLQIADMLFDLLLYVVEVHATISPTVLVIDQIDNAASMKFGRHIGVSQQASSIALTIRSHEILDRATAGDEIAVNASLLDEVRDVVSSIFSLMKTKVLTSYQSCFASM